MVATAFLIVPHHGAELGDDWPSLSRSAKLELMRRQNEALTNAIKLRLEGMEIQYLEGVGGWRACSAGPMKREEIEKKLEDLPISVAPDGEFHAM